MNLAGKVIVVAGSSGKLATDYINAVSALGATVLFVGLDGGDVATFFEERGQPEGLAGVHSFRGSDSASVEALVEKIVASHDRVDVLLNATEPYSSCTFADTEDDIGALIETRFCTSYRMVQAILPHMRRQRFGRIVNIASGIGMFGSAGKSAFSAASAAVAGFTRSLALEVKHLGIHVNAIAPYALDFGKVVREIPRSESEMAAPVLAYLSHPDCVLSGEILTVGEGRVSRYFTNTGPGYLSYSARIEDIAEHLDVVTSTQSAVTPLRAEDELLLVDV